jgi:2,5-furandicarboxylate decarboxylase 1
MVGIYREYLGELGRLDRIKLVEEEVDTNLGISRVINQSQQVPVLFNKIKGFEGSKVIGNLCPTRQDLSFALKVEEKKLTETVIKAFSNPKRPKSISKKDSWIVEKPDLERLPVPKYYEGDGGKYFTSSIIVSRFPKSKEENLSIHRIMILNKREGVIRILPRHLNKILEEEGGKADVAMLVGVHPAIFLAAALSANYEVSEYNIANALLGEKMELVEMENGVMVPKGVETVLLGTIDVHEREKEGPFVDITGTYDAVREEPVISFEKMLIPSDGVIFQALLPAGKEHRLFMGIPQEIKIILHLRKIGIEVDKINLTDGGCAYFHCIVSIKKKNNDDGLKVIKEIFNVAHPIKLVTVVDDDINPFDYEMVEWALATRFQADRGLEVIHNQRGSSLDPSSFKKAITSKVGVDATLQLNIDKNNFKKARIL